MQTECIPGQLEFEASAAACGCGVRRRAVASDAGRCCCGRRIAIGLIDRAAPCFRDVRDPGRVVHSLRTLIRPTMTTCVSIQFWRCSRIGWNRAVPTVRRWVAAVHPHCWAGPPRCHRARLRKCARASGAA